MPMQRRTLLAGLGALLLAGCGFQLRRPPVMPFSTILLSGFSPRSPLAEELRHSLAGVTGVVDTPDRAQVVLESLTDAREKVVAASTSAGQVREVQLRVRLKFRLRTPAGRELLPADELLLTRDMSYNETNALGKEQEEAQLYRALQSDIIAQLMRRLAAVQI
jgi:LPS-assembly lipoprotein